MGKFTHIDEHGQVRMVDVTDKKSSERIAVAQGVVSMNPATFEKIQNQKVKKGNVLETARIAGVMAAKKTSDIIPMCHPINITHIAVDFYPQQDACAFKIEMEALTAVSVAALTIYDMCKSYDKAMTISDICLSKKSGGKSGTFMRINSEDTTSESSPQLE